MSRETDCGDVLGESLFSEGFPFFTFFPSQLVKSGPPSKPVLVRSLHAWAGQGRDIKWDFRLSFQQNKIVSSGFSFALKPTPLNR